jgi:U3 small nucleolar RNA-associated protein 12
VAETGICRLTGHKSIITKLAFMKEHNIIISSSKDTFVKFWDLDTEHNFKTLIGHRSEVSCSILLLYFEHIIFG